MSNSIIQIKYPSVFLSRTATVPLATRTNAEQCNVIWSCSLIEVELQKAHNSNFDKIKIAI